MPVTGPDFISLQTRDPDASQAFYEQYLGLVRSPGGPPHAVVFETRPIAFALRDLVPGTDWAEISELVETSYRLTAGVRRVGRLDELRQG